MQEPHLTKWSHDFTKKQKEELKDLIEDVQEKEQRGESGEYMYRVWVQSWNWYVKKIQRKERHSSSKSK